jgi:GNAT superfamily N-acetyltransferase
LIFAPDHSLVAFVECWLNHEPPVHPWVFGCVHPEHWGKGIGSHILTWAEDRAREALEKCADLRAPAPGTQANNEAGRRSEQLGWKHIRSYYRMISIWTNARSTASPRWDHNTPV